MHLADSLRLHTLLARWIGPLSLAFLLTAYAWTSEPASTLDDIAPAPHPRARNHGENGPCLRAVASKSNDTLHVLFDRPMGDAAAHPDNYVIVRDDGSHRTLSVLTATFVGEDFNQVRLTTSPQTTTNYLLTVVDVEDALERRPAPASGHWNPMAGSFAGTPDSFSTPQIDRHRLLVSEQKN